MLFATNVNIVFNTFGLKKFLFSRITTATAVNPEVIYTAAHAEFPDREPLGGGKAVADWLIREWRREQQFPLSVLSPTSIGLTLPKPLTRMSELGYARFCREFERVTTKEIMKRGPRECVVLANDISEGPNFADLGKRGYRVITIFHVDVVEFFTKFYLRDVVRPDTVAKFRRFSILPDVLRLVFEKQYDCLRQSEHIIVPSSPMRETILRCYPWCDPRKIIVLPWGNIHEIDKTRPAVAPYQIAEDEFVIMTLSRLSPEKGIERLLAAMPKVEPRDLRLRVFICGSPAYMRGRAYGRKLRRLAAKVTNARVEFTGHVTGELKTALLCRVDLFVSTSRHESYGLTIEEARAAGCRVISHPHYGASGIVVDCADSGAFAAAINKTIAAGRTPRETTCTQRSDAARNLGHLLLNVARSASTASRVA
jgi:glycosyltransferase involved in cell wall biosynthesis